MKGITYIEDFFFRSYWVIFSILLFMMIYEQGLKQRNKDLEILNSQLAALENEQRILVEEHNDLILQINSQNDPAWIELTLMRVLGLVPEGYKKILFISKDGKE